jgi:hypothetical protein
MMYRIKHPQRLSQETWLNKNEHGSIELTCEDDYYSGELSRRDSVALANELVLCLCGHSVNAHLNSETQCNGRHGRHNCYCQKFILDVLVAKEALKP